MDKKLRRLLKSELKSVGAYHAGKVVLDFPLMFKQVGAPEQIVNDALNLELIKETLRCSRSDISLFTDLGNEARGELTKYLQCLSAGKPHNYIRFVDILFGIYLGET
jgi:hypothetical protein